MTLNPYDHRPAHDCDMPFYHLETFALDSRVFTRKHAKRLYGRVRYLRRVASENATLQDFAAVKLRDFDKFPHAQRLLQAFLASHGLEPEQLAGRP